MARKLTDDDARQIRALRAAGTPLADAAAQFGVHYSTVSLVATGRLHAAAGGVLTQARYLSDEEVRGIRERRAAGESVAGIASSLGRPVSTIRNIVLGRTHKDAGGPIAVPRVYTPRIVTREGRRRR